MAKVAAYVKSFNGGEFSVILEGRTDLDRYPASTRLCYNFVPLPQGPVSRRTGTRLQVPVHDEAKVSALIPFIFNEVQVFSVEIAENKIRFHNEAGVLARPPIAISAIVAGVTVAYAAAGHMAVVGDQVVLGGFEPAKNLSSVVGNVTAVAGDIVTTDIPTPAGGVGSLATATSATVYAIAGPYLAADVQNVRFLPDEDALYLFCDGYPPQKLSRFGAYDWTITPVVFIDGPYDSVNDSATRMTPSGTGNAIVVMTADNMPAGWTSSSSGASGGNDAFHAFDDDTTTYWESNSNQTGTLEIQFIAAAAVDGYVIEMANVNTDVNYSAPDYAPGDWKFQGSDDGTTWKTLDSQIGYVLYDNNRTVYFPIKNTHAYAYYRLDITKTTRNGPLPPRVNRLLMTTRASATINLTVDQPTNINGNQGYLSTDVGRLVRFQGVEGCWRSLQIAAVVSNLQITATFQADVLSSLDDTTNWALGLISQTTGYPTSAGWFEDRMWIGGMLSYPDWFAFSVTGKYETFAPTNYTGDVEDDNGFAGKLQTRRRGRLAWIATDGRAVLLGTSSAIWSVQSSDPQSGISAKTAKARRQSVRGAANVEPSTVDRQNLFIQRGNRTLREAIYSFAIDGYDTSSMSIYAGHIGARLMLQQDFAYEPYSINWVRLNDGTVAGFVYNKEQSVLGWFIADFGGFVESICVLPSQTTSQDVLWMTIRRTTPAGTRRFVEVMEPLWDFDTEILDAWFVDGGIVYDGVATTDVYGLQMYENMIVVGLADGSPITPTVVVNGHIALATAASKILIGLPFDSELETSRLDAGSANGTAMGKWKRIHEMKMRLWDTGGGEYAVRDADGNVTDYEKLDYLTPETQLDVLPGLFTGDTKKLDMPQAYNTEGTVLFRQDGSIPLPMNVVALMPQLMTQDGG